MILHILKDMFPVEQAIRLYWVISSKYREPHRHYHNLKHIETMLGLYFEKFMVRTPEMVLAILFHDFVYNTDEKFLDNEKNSVIEANKYLDVFEKGPRGDSVASLILSKEPKTEQEKILHDLDYSILCNREELFNYNEGIKKELGHFSDFKETREKFLLDLLNKDYIYYSVFSDDVAKENIRLLLKESLNEETKEPVA